MEETGIGPEDTVAVIGLGPIGLMFVRLAKVYGARVIALGRRQTQLDRAARMGADEVVAVTDGLDPAKARLRAPAIANFQPAATFRPADAIPVAPGRGWLLILEEGP